MSCVFQRQEIINPDGSNVWKTIHSQVRLIHVNTSQAVKVGFLYEGNRPAGCHYRYCYHERPIYSGRAQRRPAAKQNGKPIHARKFDDDVSVRPPVRTDWQGGTKWTMMGGVGESKTCSLRLYRRNVSQFT